ncbi:MAG: plasmid mobilization relaxosome protein MobC [Mailhella sp.]|nr:plasmid mobilization relaxosome protein MobC [Mailhella sp.]
MKKKTHARSTAVVIRVHPEERDLLKLNAGLHGMNVSGYVRQTCLGLRLRRTPEERRRLRDLARIGSNLNQIARWANTYKESLEAVEVLAALTSLETQIENFASGETGDSGEESILADESILPRHGRWRSPCPLPHP